MSRKYEAQNASNPETAEKEQEYAYKNVIKDKQHRRTWSVAALVLSVLSVLLTYFSWVGLVLALGAGGCAAMSRKNLGYFDKISLAGIIIAIFGAMFALTGLIFGEFLSTVF